jgi:Na+/glutamate symporter
MASTVHEDLYEVTTSRQILLALGKVSDKVVEKIRTRISCQIPFYKNCAIYGVITKNTGEPDKPQMIQENMAQKQKKKKDVIFMPANYGTNTNYSRNISCLLLSTG